MSVYSRPFVRELRRRVRQETKLNPEWKKEARALRKPRHFNLGSVFRKLVPLAALFIGFTEKGFAVALPLLLGWCTAVMVVRAAQIQALLFGLSESSPFYQFPVSEGFVFRQVRRRILLTSLWMAADVGGLLAGMALHTGSENWFGVAGGVACMWAVVVATAVVLVWCWPRFPFAWIAGVLNTSGFVAVWLVGSDRLWSVESVVAFYHSVKWWLPTGWASVLCEAWILNAELPPVLVVLPVLGLFGFLTAAWIGAGKLETGFVFWEPPWVAKARAEAPTNEPSTERVSDVEAQIGTRSFLRGDRWAEGGVIERLGLGWLTARERRVADLMLIEPPGWTSRYWYGLGLVAVTPWLARLAAHVMKQPEWILGGGLLVGLGLTTPLVAGMWSGFATAPFGHRVTAVFVQWPVGLREVRNTLLKLNFTRLILAVPCWIYAGAAVASWFGYRLTYGMALGAKAWLLCAAMQPFFLVFKYSSGTNDTRSGCLFVLGFYGSVLVVLSLLALAGTLAVRDENLAQWCGATVALGVAAWLMEAAYRRTWRAQRFDLTAPVQDPSE